MYLYVAHAVCAAVGYHPINDSVLTIYTVRMLYMHVSAIVFMSRYDYLIVPFFFMIFLHEMQGYT